MHLLSRLPRVGVPVSVPGGFITCSQWTVQAGGMVVCSGKTLPQSGVNMRGTIVLDFVVHEQAYQEALSHTPDANESDWLHWPERSGPHYVHHNGEMWVGQVELREDPGSRKIYVWKGSAVFTLYANNYSGAFRFKPIIWPAPPTN